MALERERIADTSLEWLEADGLGGFASGTPSGARTRRYHGLLAAATTPPTGRRMLVPAVEAWIDAGSGPRALTSHRYEPGVTHPDGASRIVEFEHAPSPRWVFELEGGVRVEQRFFVRRGAPLGVLTWRVLSPRTAVRLSVRPLLAARDVHALQREDAAFSTDATRDGPRVRWTPGAGEPAIDAWSTGEYRHEPFWYRGFRLEEELARGYDGAEDLASPGVFELELGDGTAALAFAAALPGAEVPRLESGPAVRAWLEGVWEEERARRAAYASPLDRAADDYLVRRGDGSSLIAGYPWFTDWGRDTLIAMRGLLIARGRFAEAQSVLARWAAEVRAGLLPNRFVDGVEEPEYHSVDAPLWFAVAARELLELAERSNRAVDPAAREAIVAAVRAILSGFANGTSYGIGADADGLLMAGERGWQLTWMDARVGDRVVTPRIGKPVEVQALWINALAIGAELGLPCAALRDRARASFAERFWNDAQGCLFDVVDADRVRGEVDAALRPNQILAVGGLPYPLLTGARARSVVDVVERELWTPLGLRTLACGDPRYRASYRGGVAERDEAYHQGTAWPWLAGPFVEAWLRVRGFAPAARREARARFLAPLLAHLADAGLGHASEIADGDAPYTARGAPFQAWSLGEIVRIRRLLEPERAALGRARRGEAAWSAR